VAAVKSAGGKSVAGKNVLAFLIRLIDKFKVQTDKLEKALAHEGTSAEKHAKHFRDVVIPNMAALRELGDQLEVEMPHELWPLATYREMLFIK
jgi:glutamine synthetase